MKGLLKELEDTPEEGGETPLLACNCWPYDLILGGNGLANCTGAAG